MAGTGNSERQKEQRRNAGRKPRGKWAGTAERAALEQAKAILRQAVLDGAPFVAGIIADPKMPPELRLQAYKLAADRAGLPVQTMHDVKQDTPYTPIFFLKRDFEHAETSPDADRMDAGHRDGDHAGAH